MGWNEPDKDKNKDPWSGKNQPPDLDEALKRLQDKLKKTFLGGSGKSDEERSGSNSGGGILAVIILLVAFILWALSGIFIVDPAEKAAILRFGKYVKTVGPGPHWIPRLISSKVVVNVDRVSDYSYAAQMLTKDENLVSVALVVQYRIGDLEEYLFNVADPIESLQQATSSALRQVIGQTTLDEIITEGREAWGSSVQESLIHILSGYKTGIVVVNVSPQPARAPENVQDAFDDAIKAQEDEKRFKEQARAYEAQVVPIAEGNAKRILAEAKAFSEQAVLRAKGETAEFLELLPEYLNSPFVTGERMYLDAMQQVLSSTSKIIVDGKSGNLLYLPLEKLIGQPLPNKKQEQELAKNDNLMEQESATTFDGREIIRPTVRPGRND
ncbi:FtsH protease activity modulator HflK [Legionella oakridgensis]|uniref:Protein HflK n=2 Tax=Legionella oakridgensis TaxID=29423 RepID=W0B752_9GAMM|nr:FtsH protease activity modulator HflK [Legionella oakridgensis]AHE66368.1 HflK protein [Legionella oakridgensis ATCC 33761 = DSM 21215]ETO93874.1 protease FtsH, subunit HflK [Legionella oakridgensis RV-2-2007]KTD44009.1 protease subunit HflK [Legionella oakridgensis]STY19552.1 protease subunit HflK [Legionella longbeachae]